MTRVAREVGTEGKLGGQAKVSEITGVWKELKDDINTMIDNLRLTTERNSEQDWLKTNLARFTNMLQGRRDLANVGQLLLSELVPLVKAHHGLIYQISADGRPLLRLMAGLCRPPSGALSGRDRTGHRLHWSGGPMSPKAARIILIFIRHSFW